MNMIFRNLPETGWSLLVSDAEKHLPAAREIFDAFRFIPDWRIDDLMISYAPAGASVGAHVDAYDVFLLQLQGTRRWMISETFDEHILPESDMRILANFAAENTWDLQPGDMLYLPPNVAHHGIAQDDCMTGSIGFRAPSLHNLVSDFGDYMARRLPEALRYNDPELTLQAHPAEITAQTISKLKNLLLENINTDDATISDWLGEFASDNRASAQLYDSEQQFADNHELYAHISDQARLEHNPMSRFLFARHEQSARLFVDGRASACSIEFAEALCAHNIIDTRTLLESVKHPQDETLLLELFNKQCLLIVDEHS